MTEFKKILVVFEVKAMQITSIIRALSVNKIEVIITPPIWKFQRNPAKFIKDIVTLDWKKGY